MRTAAPPPLPPLPAEPGETVVSGAVMPAAAHLRLSSDTLGEVALHLRLQDGAAHIRIEGTDKSAVEARAPELVRALAAEGIGLARIEVQTSPARPDSDGSPGGMQPDLQRQSNPGEGGGQDPSPWDGGEARSPSASAPTLSPNTAPRPARAHPGAVDVTA
ncbi:MAG TPA: flagellar hook-length control protein FliK [Anaeromyxobacter sp.]|nr:flagellar hook-length control protein FliK [Anaeromyxobacter sp.]